MKGGRVVLHDVLHAESYVNRMGRGNDGKGCSCSLDRFLLALIGAFKVDASRHI